MPPFRGSNRCQAKSSNPNKIRGPLFDPYLSIEPGAARVQHHTIDELAARLVGERAACNRPRSPCRIGSLELFFVAGIEHIHHAESKCVLLFNIKRDSPLLKYWLIREVIPILKSGHQRASEHVRERCGGFLDGSLCPAPE